MDVPLWLSILLYAVAAIAVAAAFYLLVLYAIRQALREPLAELRTARRRQEDLLRDISGSATYLADVADVWAEGEAERRAAEPGDAPRRGVLPVDEVDDSERRAWGPEASDAAEPGDEVEPGDAAEPGDEVESGDEVDAAERVSTPEADTETTVATST